MTVKRIYKGGFSLIELMVAMGILSVLMLMLTLVLDQVQKSWTYSESRISQFREARVAFDLMTKNLSQASLNTYWDLKDNDPPDGLVDGYFRTSELHFEVMKTAKLSSIGSQNPVGHAVFFQAPLGFSTLYPNLNNLFNGRGYFVSFGGDREFRPSFIRSPEKFRYRLMEFRPPAESNQVFEDGAEERSKQEEQQFTEWWRQGMSVGEGSFEDHLNPLAENIITLIISPRDSILQSGDDRDDTASKIAPNYIYDSNTPNNEAIEQQVPPLVRVTMIAIDEASAVRLEEGSTPPEKIHALIQEPPNDTKRYDEDILTIVNSLNENNINHKVFSSMVLLRSAKWSDSSGNL